MKKIVIPIIMLLMSIILFSCAKTVVTPTYTGSVIVEEKNEDNDKPNNDFDYGSLIPGIVENSNVTYFASPNSKVNVKVELNNPSQFEILSLTINEKKYQSFEFSKGSSSDVIYIEMVMPSKGGEYQYNIDNIKYIDGSEIKDVDMSKAEKVIKFGVTYENLPKITLSNKKFTNNSFYTNVSIDDKDDILSKGRELKAYIFDSNKKLVYTSLILDGKLMYDNLKEGEDYHLVIATGIDLLDGKGGRTVVLYEEDFSTNTNANISIVTKSFNSISYEVSVLNDKTTIDSVILVDLTTNETRDVTNIYEIDNLLSNRKYQLVLTYTYLNNQYNVKVSTETKCYSDVNITSFNGRIDHCDFYFDYVLDDKDNRTTRAEFVVYKDNQVIKKLNAFTTKYISLDFNTKYRIDFIVYYDLLDGFGERSVSVSNEYKTLKSDPYLESLSQTITSNSYSLSLTEHDLHNDGDIKVIKLYEGTTLIAEYAPTFNVMIENLKSNTNYIIEVIYTFDHNDGNGVKTITYQFPITTHKVEPTLNVEFSTTVNSAILSLDKTIDNDNAGKVTNVKLLLNGVVVSEGVSLEFNNLNSNTLYEFEVTYTYDLNDNMGERIKTFKGNFKTLAYKLNVNYSNLKSSANTISFDVDVLDESNTFNIIKIELLKDNKLVTFKENILDYKNITFDSLTLNTNYKILVTYSYDLNDGNGKQVKELEFYYSTTSNQSVDVYNVEVLTTNITSGSNVDIRIYLNNPLNLNINGIYIDNVKYNVNHTFVDSVVVSILPDSNGGIYNINITGYSYIINSNEFSESLKKAYVHQITILGELEILSFSSINNKHYVNYGTPEISIKFDGSLGYEIVSFETNERIYNTGDFNVISNGEIRFASSIYPLNTIILKNITYKVGEITNKINVNLVGDFYVVTDSQIRSISKAEDFALLENDLVYELTNDIDFTNVVHTPIDFNGVILGNNYKITNFNLNVNSSNYIDEYGLFGNFKGYIGNLTFENSYINVASTNSYSKTGVIAGASQNSYFENINILGTTLIGDGYVGGLVGQLGVTDSYYTVSNVTISGEISGKSDTGGLTSLSSGFANIDRFTNNANIKSGKNVAGVLASHDGELKISNSHNAGAISSTGLFSKIAGFIGKLISTNAILVNLFNSGTISEDFFGDSYGIIAYIDGSPIVKNSVSIGSFGKTNETFENCFSTINGDVNVNTITEDRLHNKEFWLNLKFNEKIWNLDNLLNGYPTLK